MYGSNRFLSIDVTIMSEMAATAIKSAPAAIHLRFLDVIPLQSAT
jgi:hypothetical protein